MTIRQGIVALAIFYISTLCAETSGQELALSDATLRVLQELDSTIAKAPFFVNEKEDRLTLLKKGHSRRSDKQRLLINDELYEEYKVYDSDSALKYVDDNIAIANNIGDNASFIDNKIRQSFIMSTKGLMKEAFEALNEVKLRNMSSAQKAEYFAQVMYAYSRESSDTKINLHEQEASNDSVMKYIAPDAPLYTWYLGCDKMCKGEDLATVELLLDSIVAHPADSREYAMHAYLLARTREAHGDTDGYIRNLARSGIADVKSCNKDVASIEELGMWMNNNGHVDKAFVYLNYCFEIAQQYNNRLRVLNISRTLNGIRQYYMEQNEQKEHRLNIYMASLAIAALCLIVVIFLLMMQFRKVKTSRKSLAKANEQLTESLDKLSQKSREVAEALEELKATNAQIQQRNDELKESNYLKEEYIGYAFNLCNSYLKKLDDYRLSINRKLKVGQTQEVVKMTSSSQMIEDELKDFLHEFDTFFLNMYPTFVSDFNKLLLPEEQIIPRSDEKLNTTLRIYALIRLGINDSIKIASFLHCSPQTIYNNRLKTRNKAIIPKEEFAEAVKNLSKMSV